MTNDERAADLANKLELDGLREGHSLGERSMMVTDLGKRQIAAALHAAQAEALEEAAEIARTEQHDPACVRFCTLCRTAGLIVGKLRARAAALREGRETDKP